VGEVRDERVGGREWRQCLPSKKHGAFIQSQTGVGADVGFLVGGEYVGMLVGKGVGTPPPMLLGAGVGYSDGLFDGLAVGAAVGVAVGYAVASHK
jgi:hypothetical protein